MHDNLIALKTALASCVALVFISTNSVGACNGAAKSGAEAGYTADLLACVDHAKTLEESRACRDGVNKRWGVADAGAK